MTLQQSLAFLANQIQAQENVGPRKARALLADALIRKAVVEEVLGMATWIAKEQRGEDPAAEIDSFTE